MSENISYFQIIRKRTDELLLLADQLANVTTTIELTESRREYINSTTELDDIQQSIKDCTMEIKEANQSRNLMLQEGTINKLIKWSNELSMIMEQLSQIMNFNQIASSHSIKDIEGKFLSIVEKLIDILIDNVPQFFNELGFFKDIANRKTVYIKK